MLNPNPNANPNAAAVTLTLTHPHISWRARLLPHRQALDDPRDATGTTRLRHPTDGLVYGVNATGLERLDASWFVNHGEDLPCLTPQGGGRRAEPAFRSA